MKKMIELEYPVFQLFSDSTISYIENPEILKKMNKRYVEGMYWQNSLIIDSKHRVYDLINIKVINKHKHFSFYDLFYTMYDVELQLIEQSLDDVFFKRLKKQLGSLWSKLEKEYNMDNLYNFLLKAYNKQAIDC